MTLKKQVLYIALSSCVIEEEIRVVAQGDPLVDQGENSDDLAPGVLDESRFPDEAKMTSVLWGTRQAGGRLKAVSIAAKEGAKGIIGKTRFSFAAAEYHSQNKDSEAMWQMKWLSRLIRFQLGGGIDVDDYLLH